MRVVKTISSLRKSLNFFRRTNKRIGFVPTMGALHEGHASLLRKARAENEIVVLSIFVNPAQFGPKEDFAKYPREGKKDKLLAIKEKVDIIFYPSVEEIYPSGYLTYLDVETLGSVLCGEKRKAHFRGVATIVAKLLNIVQPHVLYLGSKDFQQATILKRMVADLNFPSTINVCPTIREKDGLAVSSRNKYLNAKERREAVVLYRSLKNAKKEISFGQNNADKIVRRIRENIKKYSCGNIEYIRCVDAETLQRLKRLNGKVLIALAVRFGKTRLIDNIIVDIK